jgi:hypothetical protein
MNVSQRKRCYVLDSLSLVHHPSLETVRIPSDRKLLVLGQQECLPTHAWLGRTWLRWTEEGASILCVDGVHDPFWFPERTLKDPIRLSGVPLSESVVIRADTFSRFIHALEEVYAVLRTRAVQPTVLLRLGGMRELLDDEIDVLRRCLYPLLGLCSKLVLALEIADDILDARDFARLPEMFPLQVWTDSAMGYGYTHYMQHTLNLDLPKLETSEALLCGFQTALDVDVRRGAWG